MPAPIGYGPTWYGAEKPSLSEDDADGREVGEARVRERVVEKAEVRRTRGVA